MMKAAENTIYRLFVCILLLIIVTHLHADDGEILDRKVRIESPKGTRYQLLRQLSEQTGFLFIYDSEVIDNDKEISVTPGEYSLRNAIYTIAGTNRLDIKIVGNHIALSFPTRQEVIATPSAPAKQEIKYSVITGRIFDMYSKELIPSATITINNTNIGTVSNKDGAFRLAIPDSLVQNAISISHVGYENKVFHASDAKRNHIELPLEPKVISLQEVVIRVVDPVHVLEQMIRNRDDNYAQTPSWLTAFYRENIEHKKKNLDLTEAVLGIYKTGYQRENIRDQVKLIKMRRTVDRQERDTLLTKVRSGINSMLMLDVVKYLPEFLLFNNTHKLFDYTYTDMSVVDNRLVYVISFEQKKGITDPLFKGRLYVDTENYALLEVHFEINPEYVEKATNMFVEKHSKRLRLTLRRAAYSVSYRPSTDGKYYINHVRGDIDFRVRRRRQLFSSTLKVWFEMVNCKVDTVDIQPIPKTERLSPRTVFSETPHAYDPDFWGSFNVIVPEEELKAFIVNQINNN